MKPRNLGIIIIVLGVLMMIYTGFNFITTEKVVDIGPIQIDKEKNHPIQWSPIVGLVLIVGGGALIVLNKKD